MPGNSNFGPSKVNEGTKMTSLLKNQLKQKQLFSLKKTWILFLTSSILDFWWANFYSPSIFRGELKTQWTSSLRNYLLDYESLIFAKVLQGKMIEVDSYSSLIK